MGVRAEVGDNLVARNAHADGAADGLARNLPSDHIGVAGRKAGEELQDGDLKR